MTVLYTEREMCFVCWRLCVIIVDAIAITMYSVLVLLMLFRCERTQLSMEICLLALQCQYILNNDYRMHHSCVKRRTQYNLCNTKPYCYRKSTLILHFCFLFSSEITNTNIQTVSSFSREKDFITLCITT